MDADDIIAFANRVKLLEQIADEVWFLVGGYGGIVDLDSKAMNLLRKYHKFDDSE